MRISDAIEPVLAAGTRGELIDAATAGAGDVVTSDGVRVAELRMAPSVAYQVIRQGLPAPDPSPTIVRSPLSHPLVAEYVRTRFRGWLSVQDILPGRAWRTHPLYREVYRPLGLSAQISCALRDLGKVMFSLSLNRAGRDFDERERDRLEEYRRLVHAAWLRVEELEAVRSVLASLRDQREDDAMVVLTASPVMPRIVYCTEAMRRLLWEQVDLWEVIQRTAASADDVGARITTPAISGRRLIAVRTGDAVVVHAVQASLPDVTSREREILAALAAGGTARAIGRQLSISERTVHKHLQNLYAKVGVHDRLSAVTVARRAGLS